MWRIMRQAGLPGLEDDVKVIAHKAVGQRPGVKARKTLFDHCQEQLAVVVVFEDQVAPGPLPGHMVKHAFEFQSAGGHPGRLRSYLGEREDLPPFVSCA